MIPWRCTGDIVASCARLGTKPKGLEGLAAGDAVGVRSMEPSVLRRSFGDARSRPHDDSRPKDAEQWSFWDGFRTRPVLSLSRARTASPTSRPEIVKPGIVGNKRLRVDRKC